MGPEDGRGGQIPVKLMSWVLPTQRACGMPIGHDSGVRKLPDEALVIVDRLAKQYKSGPIFRNRNGEPWKKDAIKCRFARLKEKLNTPELCATTLRHSYAHYQLTSGTDSHIVSKLMGHSTEKMLLERYGHVEQNPEFMANQANRIRSPLTPLDPQSDTAEDTSQNQPQ